MSTDNPFEDDKIISISEPVDIVRRLAEIKDELASRGLDPLIKEEEELRKLLKDYMLSNQVDEVYDENSNYQAVFIQRYEDIWQVPILKKIISKTQRERYVEERVNLKGVQEGVKTGDLSRAVLEQKGAVKRQAKGKPALYVREKRQEDDADNDSPW